MVNFIFNIVYHTFHLIFGNFIIFLNTKKILQSITEYFKVLQNTSTNTYHGWSSTNLHINVFSFKSIETETISVFIDVENEKHFSFFIFVLI